MFKYIFEEIGEQFDENVMEQCKQRFAEGITKVRFQMNPGVDRLIRHLHSNGIPMAIASNMKKKDLDFYKSLMIGFDISLFSHEVSGSDDPEVINNKPAADVFLVCAKRFSIPPKSLDSCVIFEDSLIGIKGAIASGMKTVLINNNRGTDFDAIVHQITAIMDSFDGFKPELVGLPSYD